MTHSIGEDVELNVEMADIFGWLYSVFLCYIFQFIYFTKAIS